MALSDLHEEPAVWRINPLRNSKVQPPRFLRTQWDEASARAFGPWRVAEKVDPTKGLATELPTTLADACTPPDEADLAVSEVHDEL